MTRPFGLSYLSLVPYFHRSLRACAAIAFLALGIGHVACLPKFVAVYETLGTGQWLRTFAGVVYLLGGTALAFRRTYRVSAALLGLLMGGVIFVDIMILNADPLPAVVLGLACFAIFWLPTDARLDRKSPWCIVGRVPAK